MSQFMERALSSCPQRSTRVCAVLRHAERADNEWDGIWSQTPEAQSWPHDPPLSDHGLEEASRAAAELVGSIELGYAKFQVVVSSPYFRCVQTAVAVCQAIGPSVVLLLDAELSEVYGPDVMGDDEPARRTRPIEHIQRYCETCGVVLRLHASETMLGQFPIWPETLARARQRFVGRFLRYLERNSQTQRSFVLVTHADGVASALSTMPCMHNRAITKVENAGFFIAHANLPQKPWSSGRSHAGTLCKSQSPTCASNVDSIADEGPLMAPANGWSVKCSGIALGERFGEDLSASIKQWSRKTVFSEQVIAKLLHCLPERTLKDAGRCSIASRSLPSHDDKAAMLGPSHNEWQRQISSTSTELFGEDWDRQSSCASTAYNSQDSDYSSKSLDSCESQDFSPSMRPMPITPEREISIGSIHGSDLWERRRKLKESTRSTDAISSAGTASHGGNEVSSVLSL